MSKVKAMTIFPDDLYISGLKRLFGGEAFAEVAPTFDAAAGWLRALTDAKGADGLSLEAGREAFDMLLRDYGQEIGLQDPAIRMLPMRRRARKGFEALAAWFESTWGWKSTVSIEATSLNYQLNSTGKEEKVELQSQFCYFVEGLLQGLLFWASGGRYFEAHSLVSHKDSQLVCEFAFSKTPID